MKLHKIQTLITNNWILIFIFLIATLLRVWDVPNRLIFFDDAAYDIRAAQVALDNREVPLLGIPSSVPRFKQGPVAVWFNMGIGLFFGTNITAYAVFYILLSLLAMVLTYEFCDRFLSRRISLITSVLIAVSPLAVAQARMPYHTNPIPLALIIYLFALVKLFQKKRHSLFFAILAWAFLFQFELAVFPTVLAIPYILYRNNELKLDAQKLKEAAAGLLLGLLPQIIYDLFNSFSQLGLFFVWVGYRIVSLFGGQHSLSGNKVETFSDSFFMFTGRIFATDIPLIAIIALGLALYAIIRFFISFRKNRTKTNRAEEVIVLFTLLLSVGYFAHGAPSEAYFPPYIIVLPMLVALALNHIFKKRDIQLGIILALFSFFNVYSIFSHNFFVSNQQDFSYSYSYKEQKEVVEFIIKESQGDFQFDTTRNIRQFKSVFDNLRIIAQNYGYPENADSKKYFYIEDKDSVLKDGININIQRFPSVDVYYYAE